MTELTRRHFAALTAMVAGLAVMPGAAFAADSEDARLAAFFEAIYERDTARSPLRQARLGLKRDQDKWDDVSEARTLENQRLLVGDLARLRGFDKAKLSPQSLISYKMFERSAEEAIADFPLRRDDYLMTQMGGMHTRIPLTLLNSHPIDNLADAQAYVTRVERVGPLMTQVLVELTRQEQAGVKPPRFVYALLIEPSENMLKGRPFDAAADKDSPILADFRAKIAKAKLADADQAALLKRCEAALTGPFGDAYERLIAHLRAAEASADARDGVWKLPDGARFYRQQLESFTTLKVEPAELHALGLSEVARIHNEMASFLVVSGFCGSFLDFFHFVGSDPRFFYAASDDGRRQYLAAAARLLDGIRARQGELFGVLPKASVEVRAVEKWREKSAAKAFYQNPPIDGSRPGIFYINLYDVKAQPKWQLPVTLYHEAIPGHHIETCVAHEMEGLPRFRRFASISAFSEGWGLYSEKLCKEIGMYTDPYDDFGRLSLELMRACRLVVDTGIHEMKWSRAQATGYMDDNMPSSHYDNQREIDRYIVYPGQATSYYVGMRKIMELRARAKAKLGAAFDLRRFHDMTLGNGPLPLPILEEVIDGWIAGGGKAVTA